jgi:hypothetical protein
LPAAKSGSSGAQSELSATALIVLQTGQASSVAASFGGGGGINA